MQLFVGQWKDSEAIVNDIVSNTCIKSGNTMLIRKWSKKDEQLSAHTH